MITLNQYWELRRCFKSLKNACLAIQASKTSEKLQEDYNYIDILNTTTAIQILLLRFSRKLAQEYPEMMPQESSPWSNAE